MTFSQDDDRETDFCELDESDISRSIAKWPDNMTKIVDALFNADMKTNCAFWKNWLRVISHTCYYTGYRVHMDLTIHSKYGPRTTTQTE